MTGWFGKYRRRSSLSQSGERRVRSEIDDVEEPGRRRINARARSINPANGYRDEMANFVKAITRD